MRARHGAAAAAALGLGLALAAAPGIASATHGGDTRVTVGSPASPFSQNKQNEPAVAIDAHQTNVLAAGANDNIDMEACNAGADNTCPFTPGVGVSGVYFSFDSGDTWVQPTYTGLTGRGCLGVVGNSDPGCTPTRGPIGTLPWYYENGLSSGGDPALAFGPRRGADGRFSWANGSRLYYANLSSSITPGGAFKGVEAVVVSRTDDVRAAAAGDMGAWRQPVIVSKQSSTTFSDKEQIWADNASSSPFFGNVYLCWASFRSNSHGQALPVPLQVARSTDGGATWTVKQVGAAVANAQASAPDGCTVRTDSHGAVYVFGIGTPVGTKTTGEVMYKSTDGGRHWSRPVLVQPAVEPGVFDPVARRPVLDGVAGARADLSAAPSVDIANGAPTGADATNRIVMTWVDGRDGLNHEHVLFTTSTNGGRTWSSTRAIETAGDRGLFTAPAISPDGRDVYVVYNAFTNPYRDSTTQPRSLVAVVKHADVTGAGVGSFATLHRTPPGDPRGSTSNSLVSEFLGDYVYAAATRTYGVAVWNDVRNAADCPAVDAYRLALREGQSATPPAPEQDCPATFGNQDIYGGSYADPTTP